jgi:protein gp37
MGDGSKIQWTDASWNPATGCSHVSEGCDHCYAESLTRQKAAAGVWEAPDLPWTAENAAENVILHPERMDQPLRWRKPRMIFVNSMSDLFHPRIPTRFLVEVFNVMAKAPHHTFQVLTKRPKRMRDFVGAFAKSEEGWITHNGNSPEGYGGDGLVLAGDVWPLPNVWLGTSIESRDYVGRADLLRETPAKVRFISAEPLLGPLVFDTALPTLDGPAPGEEYKVPEHNAWSDRADAPQLDLTDIHWLIVGGESGQDHRPIEASWVRDLRDHCIRERDNLLPGTYDQDTAFFFKQWGGRTAKAGGRELDGKTWDEFPPHGPRVLDATG